MSGEGEGQEIVAREKHFKNRVVNSFKDSREILKIQAGKYCPCSLGIIRMLLGRLWVDARSEWVDGE